MRQEAKTITATAIRLAMSASDSPSGTHPYMNPMTITKAAQAGKECGQAPGTGVYVENRTAELVLQANLEWRSKCIAFVVLRAPIAKCIPMRRARIGFVPSL